MFQGLKQRLKDSGSTVVGFAAVEDVLSHEIAHLKRAVCIGVRSGLRDETIELLGTLQKEVGAFLREKGHRFLIIPPDSDRVNGTFVSKLYPLFTHKAAATCSGLGWIGRNGLLISSEHGPRLSLATVLTDADLEPDEPITASGCGECELCRKHCPAGAITGRQWSRSNPFPVMVNYKLCASHKLQRRAGGGKPNCGLCINICPYGRKNGISSIAIRKDILLEETG